MQMDAEARIRVWHQVLADFKHLGPVESKCFRGFDLPPPKTSERKTAVEIIQKDCVYAAIDQVRLGMNPLLLNMASEFRAGGGVHKGSAAQEEEIFRRSDYFRHLGRHHYPLDDLDALVSEGVLFYRLSRNEGYGLMQKPTKIDCVAAAAVRKPEVTKNGRRFLHKEDAERMQNKIRTIFTAGSRKGNDCLVLSAWGCGAFGCPVEHVARLFREVVEEYQGVFERVVFAIWDAETFEAFRGAYDKCAKN